MASVAIVMGSDSDWKVMQQAQQVLTEFGVESDVEVLSAHRTPEKMISWGKEAAAKGIKIIIAGAGGAAHLPGMLASVSSLPVIGVPVSLNNLDGMDSLLSIVQMPAGIPVATVSIAGAKNAGILAARILSTSNKDLEEKLLAYGQSLSDLVAQKNEDLKQQISRGGK